MSSLTEKTMLSMWARVVGVVVLGILAVSGWLWRDWDDQPPQPPPIPNHVVTPVPSWDQVSPFPLVRVPGVVSTYAGNVEFVANQGSWLLLLVDVSQTGKVVLPSDQVWMGGWSIDPTQQLDLYQNGEFWASVIQPQP